MSEEKLVSLQALTAAKNFGAHMERAANFFRQGVYSKFDPLCDFYEVKAELRKAIKSVESIEFHWRETHK
jgi:hypothetical protein